LDELKKWLIDLGFPSGPIAVSVDDTKIVSGIRSYRDAGVWKLGGMHGCVETFDSYEELLQKSKVKKEDLSDKVVDEHLRIHAPPL
jgi:hypothetical protein